MNRKETCQNYYMLLSTKEDFDLTAFRNHAEQKMEEASNTFTASGIYRVGEVVPFEGYKENDYYRSLHEANLNEVLYLYATRCRFYGILENAQVKKVLSKSNKNFEPPPMEHYTRLPAHTSSQVAYAVASEVSRAVHNGFERG